MNKDNKGITPEELSRQVANNLVDNAQLLSRFLGGHKASPLADENYDTSQLGHVSASLRNELTTLHPEIVAQADNTQPSLTPGHIPNWNLSA